MQKHPNRTKDEPFMRKTLDLLAIFVTIAIGTLLTSCSMNEQIEEMLYMRNEAEVDYTASSNIQTMTLMVSTQKNKPISSETEVSRAADMQDVKTIYEDETAKYSLSLWNNKICILCGQKDRNMHTSYIYMQDDTDIQAGITCTGIARDIKEIPAVEFNKMEGWAKYAVNPTQCYGWLESELQENHGYVIKFQVNDLPLSSDMVHMRYVRFYVREMNTNTQSDIESITIDYQTYLETVETTK